MKHFSLAPDKEQSIKWVLASSSQVKQTKLFRGGPSPRMIFFLIYYIKKVSQSLPDSLFYHSPQGCFTVQLQRGPAHIMVLMHSAPHPKAEQSTPYLSLWRCPGNARREKTDPNLSWQGMGTTSESAPGRGSAGRRREAQKGAPLAGGSEPTSVAQSRGKDGPLWLRANPPSLAQSSPAHWNLAAHTLLLTQLSLPSTGLPN